MTTILNVYRKQTTNVGDMFSTPTLYFDFLENVEKFDIYMDYPDKKIDHSDKKIMLLGGGGLISNSDFFKAFNWLTELPFKKKIIWGAGHNTHGGNNDQFVDPLLDKYDLVGIRDFGTKYEWVPCVSCMSDAFDQEYKVKNEVVVYEHKNQPLDIIEFPKITNKQNDIYIVVKFLASAKYVITNTYHGVFWATILNKKVILINPFSNKFNRMKHPPVYSTLNTFRADMMNCVNYPDALRECRDANMRFAYKVKRLVL